MNKYNRDIVCRRRNSVSSQLLKIYTANNALLLYAYALSIDTMVHVYFTKHTPFNSH